MKIGTSGFIYKNWVGCFYPPELPKSKYLEYYAKYFVTLELNSTFYKIPKESTFKSWKYKLKKLNLSLSMKANRIITHTYKLKRPDIANQFIQKAKLVENLDAILFQLPPSLKFDADLLENFVNNLTEGKYAIEFRNKSWYNEKTYEILSSKNIALVSHDFNQKFFIKQTADFVYIRLHGYTGKYRGSYPNEFLKSLSKYENGYCYFNNTDDCSAPFDAM
ncbi:DUF72 domain-containing protein, partial [Caminibacter sp.]